MIIEYNSKKWLIREDMGYGFFIDDEDVFAVKLQENGLPHDDPVVFLVDDFDWSQEDIERVKRMICMILEDGPIITALRELDNDNKN